MESTPSKGGKEREIAMFVMCIDRMTREVGLNMILNEVIVLACPEGTRENARSGGAMMQGSPIESRKS